jgi:undecaprenyl phosphate-alpha-L-ara4N flippase subunit ArnE
MTLSTGFPLAMGILALCISAEVGRELCFKSASDRADVKAYVFGLARQPLLWLGLALYGVEMVSWVVVLQHLALSIAYPVMTLTYAGIPIASHLVLKEKMSRNQIFGALLITLGAGVVAFSGQ